MKKQNQISTKQELIVITNGTPRLENIPKDIVQQFVFAMLNLCLDYYSTEKTNIKSKPTDTVSNIGIKANRLNRQ